MRLTIISLLVFLLLGCSSPKSFLTVMDPNGFIAQDYVQLSGGSVELISQNPDVYHLEFSNESVPILTDLEHGNIISLPTKDGIAYTLRGVGNFSTGTVVGYVYCIIGDEKPICEGHTLSPDDFIIE